MPISPARQKRLEKAIASAVAEFGVGQLHQSIANVLRRQHQGPREAKRGAPKIFTEANYKTLWLTVQMAIPDLGKSEYGCCMKLTSTFFYGDDANRKRRIRRLTLYRQYLHAVHFMKTNGHPDQKVPADYGGSNISVLEKCWRSELDLQLLVRRPEDQWGQGLRSLRDNDPQDFCIFSQ